MGQTIDLDDIERRMKKTADVLRHEFAGLRTGRASVSLVEPVMVPAYGAQMPLNQVATISVPESRTISVQVWDKSLSGAVEKAIRNAGLGLNPIGDKEMIRIPIPELNEERRLELVKIAAKYGEQARVAARNIRRDGMETLRAMEKDSEISQDEHREMGTEIQHLTDDAVALIDQIFHQKEQEILVIS